MPFLQFTISHMAIIYLLRPIGESSMIVPVCGELTSIVFYAALPAVVIRNKYNLVATATWTGYALRPATGNQVLTAVVGSSK